jgi:hypothetical protein
MAAGRFFGTTIDEMRADVDEEMNRERKVNDVVAWLRAQYRTLGVDDPTRAMVGRFLATPGAWSAAQAAVGRAPTDNPRTREMVLERFPV